MVVEEVRVASWAQLLDCLYEGSWSEPLGRFRSPLAFRGLGNARYDLTTSLMRLGGEYADHEGHLLRNFRKYARRDSVPVDSLWDWLAVAQHHGLPTRLLDWTFSPFVALHMATERPGHHGADAAVWCVDYAATHRHLPASLRDLLRDEGSQVFNAEMLARVAGSLADFDRLGDDEFALFFEPPSLDERIVNQFALFSLMSSPTARLDAWLDGRDGLARRVLIPAALKAEIRDKLDQANITERVLYPGLDGLSRWLTRYYSPARPRPGPPGAGPR